MAAAAGALRPDGLLIFTLEHALAAEAMLDYRLSCTAATATRAGMSNGCSPACGLRVGDCAGRAAARIGHAGGGAGGPSDEADQVDAGMNHA